MTKLIRLQGKACHVFRTVKSLADRYPNMTLGELKERGIRSE